ncbi:MAG: hypothetical protein FGM33_04055 [Candidatus Kapabacteria bacterium]|nr:hypothetical protein [Candidatus Kapabacteria bacterium]
MTHVSKSQGTELTGTDAVIAAETAYLWPTESAADEHRQSNKHGLALGGGGIRSATMSLGIIQTLANAGILSKIDYLSTVSGGGYIGSCLTSILASHGAQGVGTAKNNSPFNDLGIELLQKTEVPTEDAPSDRKIPFTVRDQMHHLRSWGNYLARQKSLLSFDRERFLGTAMFGTLYTFVVCGLIYILAVALLHFALSTFAGGGGRGKSYIQKVDGVLTAFGYDSADAVSTHLISCNVEVIGSELCKQITNLWNNLKSVYALGVKMVSDRFAVWTFIIMGAVVAFILQVLGYQYVRTKGGGALKVDDHCRADTTRQETRNKRAMMWYHIISILMCVLGVFCANICSDHTTSSSNTHLIQHLFLSVAYAVGAYVVSLVINMYYLIRRPAPNVSSNSNIRSFHAAAHGAALYGLILTLLIPAILTIALSISFRTFVLLVVVGIGAAGRFIIQPSQGGKVRDFMRRNSVPLTNAIVFLVLFLLVGSTTDLLRNVYASDKSMYIIMAMPLVLMFLSTIDINRVGPFQFYMDRLTDAYLSTNGRVPCKNGTDTLRSASDRSALKLKDLRQVDPKNRRPYHIINAALNLPGTNELLRKDTKSAHFIFSPLYCGSKQTGYVETGEYYNGEVTLARAMTISGAATSSMMGYYSFAAQRFLAVLFNARLGQWMKNPRRQRTQQDGDNTRRQSFRSRHGIFIPGFFLRYYFREIFGWATERASRVYLSDGGHTGDNLGLLQLLIRRCEVIFVVDADYDPSYTFASFNTATRLAYTEERIEIDIDLKPLVPDMETGISQSSVVVGKITYPALAGHNASQGTLIYMKSSLSDADASYADGTVSPLPSTLWSYKRKNDAFPHDSTGDQFYDPEQFEAYRRLGNHIGKQAVALYRHS